MAQNAAFQSPHPVLVTGGPGTGKTVVSIYRFLSSLIQHKNALFFTYNRTLMASIRGLLHQRGEILLADINSTERQALIESSINSIYDWYYARTRGIFENDDESAIAVKLANFVSNKRKNAKYEQVIVDEAQDLMPKIIKNLDKLSKKISCGADSNQDLQGNWLSGSADIEIGDILNSFSYTESKELLRNYRNTRQIFAFARRFSDDPRVVNLNIEALPDGEYPELFSDRDEAEQLELIWSVVDGSQSNIGIIVFSKGDIDKIRDFFRKEKNFTDFSYYYQDMPLEDRNAMEQNLKTPFIVTYESCKGLEFDTVILPFFQKAAWALTTAKRNARPNADGTEKMICTNNHYYVAATRAKKQLYIFYDWDTTIFRNFRYVTYKLNDALVTR